VCECIDRTSHPHAYAITHARTYYAFRTKHVRVLNGRAHDEGAATVMIEAHVVTQFVREQIRVIKNPSVSITQLIDTRGIGAPITE
jgi:hypothetical protein